MVPSLETFSRTQASSVESGPLEKRYALQWPGVAPNSELPAHRAEKERTSRNGVPEKIENRRLGGGSRQGRNSSDPRWQGLSRLDAIYAGDAGFLRPKISRLQNCA